MDLNKNRSRQRYRDVEKYFTDSQPLHKRGRQDYFTEMLAIWLWTNSRPTIEQQTVGFHQLSEEIKRDITKIPSPREDKIKNQCNIDRSPHIVFLIGVHLTSTYNIPPDDCFAISKGVEMAEIGERAKCSVVSSR